MYVCVWLNYVKFLSYRLKWSNISTFTAFSLISMYTYRYSQHTFMQSKALNSSGIFWADLGKSRELHVFVFLHFFKLLFLKLSVKCQEERQDSIVRNINPGIKRLSV